VNTTYWHSSAYTFNPSKWVSGAWDAALEEAIKKMRLHATAHLISTLIGVKRALDERLCKDKGEIEFFETQFQKNAA
jgi:hypothetical protein